MLPVTTQRVKALGLPSPVARRVPLIVLEPLWALGALVGLSASGCGETRLTATEFTDPVVTIPNAGSGGGGIGSEDQTASGGAPGVADGFGGETSTSTGGSLAFATAPYYLADDFEDGLEWDVHAIDEAVIDRVTEKSRSGEHSIRFIQGSKNSEAYMALPIAPRMSGDRLHVRAWYYVPSDTVNGRVNLVSSNGVTAPDVNLLPDGMVEIFLHAGDVRVSTSPQNYPYDRWFCLESGLLVDPTEGELHVSIGGQRVISVTGEDTTTDSFEQALIGLTWVEMDQVGGVIYVDDIAVDYLPLPCN